MAFRLIHNSYNLPKGLSPLLILSHKLVNFPDFIKFHKHPVTRQSGMHIGPEVILLCLDNFDNMSYSYTCKLPPTRKLADPPKAHAEISLCPGIFAEFYCTYLGQVSSTMLISHTYVHICQNTSLLFPTAPLPWHKHQFLSMMPRTLVNSQHRPGLQVPCNAGFQPVSELCLEQKLLFF